MPKASRATVTWLAEQFWQHIGNDDTLRLCCEDPIHFTATFQDYRAKLSLVYSIGQVSPANLRSAMYKKYLCMKHLLGGTVLLIRRLDESQSSWALRQRNDSEYASSLARIQAARQESGRDKGGIAVSPEACHRSAEDIIAAAETGITWDFTITNTSATASHVVTGVCVAGQQPQGTYSLNPPQPQLQNMLLEPGELRCFTFSVRPPAAIGMFRLKLVLAFAAGFEITRLVELPMGNLELLDLLRPTKPFVPDQVSPTATKGYMHRCQACGAGLPELSSYLPTCMEFRFQTIQSSNFMSIIIDPIVICMLPSHCTYTIYMFICVDI